MNKIVELQGERFSIVYNQGFIRLNLMTEEGGVLNIRGYVGVSHRSPYKWACTVDDTKLLYTVGIESLLNYDTLDGALYILSDKLIAIKKSRDKMSAYVEGCENV